MVDPTVAATVAATKVIWAAYAGYQMGKLSQSDQALREEVRRRAEMIHHHLEPLHNDTHRDKKRRARRAIDDAMNACDGLTSDARYSVSATPTSKHDSAAQLNKKVLKKLVDHDLATLERLKGATHSVNQLSSEVSGGADEATLVQLAGEVRQKVTSARNHFSERNMIFDGLQRK